MQAMNVCPSSLEHRIRPMSCALAHSFLYFIAKKPKYFTEKMSKLDVNVEHTYLTLAPNFLKYTRYHVVPVDLCILHRLCTMFLLYSWLFL